jgi:hypothetical protein
MYHAGQDIRGNVVMDPNQCGHPGSIRHVPNLTGVGMVAVHAIGELQASGGVAVLGGLATLLHRPPLAPRDAAI